MKRILEVLLMIVLVSGLIFVVCAKPVAEAASAADFYKKNIVTIVIGFRAGGSSDYAGRLLASYWPAVTDGGAMIVKNMTGGGGMNATNYVYSAKPDGLIMGFGMVGDSYLLPTLTKDPAVRFDAKKLRWLVGVFHEPWVLHLSVKRPYESVEDLKKAKGLKFGSGHPSGVGSIVTAFLLDVLGLDGRIITGYRGGSGINLAAGKGEIDGAVIPISIGLRAVEKGFVKPGVVIVSSERVPAFPDTPVLHEVVKLTPEQEAQFEDVYAASYILRVGAAPPGVPEDRVQFMRDAFAKIVAMEGFQRQSKLSLPLGPTPMIGEKLDAFIKRALSVDIAPIKARISKYLAIR